MNSVVLLLKRYQKFFDQPRLFHLGLDEETYSHQSYQKHIVVRQGDAWWKDFYFLVEEVEKIIPGHGSGPIIFFGTSPKCFLNECQSQ